MAICLIALGAVWVVLNPAPVVQTKKEPVVKKTLAYQEAMAARDQENEKRAAEKTEATNDPIEDVLAGDQTGAAEEDLAALPGETAAEPLPWASPQPGAAPLAGTPPQAGYPPNAVPPQDTYAQDAYGPPPGAPPTNQAAPGAPNPFDRNAPGQNPYAANAPGSQQAARQRPPADPYAQGAPPYGAPPPGQPAYPGQDAYAQDPYGQDPYAQDPYAQDPYAQDPYAQNPAAQNPSGVDPEAPYGRHPYSGEPLGPDGQVARVEQPNTFPGEPPYPGQDPYGQDPYGQDPYGAPPPGQGQPVYPPQGQAAYPGQAPYGAPGQPGGQNEEWVKVISSGTGMRNSASEDAPILFAFPYGRNLKVLSRNGEWVEVSDPNSSTKGWMLAHTLEPTANPNAYAQRPYYEEQPKQRSGGLFRGFLNRAFGN